jgi:MFS transporter, DHA3 family, macrolide efflux protein
MALPTTDRGMRTFSVIWLGQLVSIIGSGLTNFVLGVWVYQSTQSVMQFALILLCGSLPIVVISPLAGALVDRWDRRRLMLAGDAGSALCVLALALLLMTSQLLVWQIYIAVAIMAVFAAFHRPAYMASISLLVPQEQLGRVNGMVQLAVALSQLIAPALAGMLVAAIGGTGALLIDLATFLCALVTLLLVRIPAPESIRADEVRAASLRHEITYGWTYLTARPGLLGLVVFFALINFLAGLVVVLMTPLVLSIASATMLGIVLSIAGSGMFCGGVLMSIWGGTRHRIHGVLGTLLIAGLCIALAGLQPSIILITGATFGFYLSLPIINSLAITILQSKVEPNIQGRIFAIIQTIAASMLPLAYLLAGPLADQVFAPLLIAGGPLADSVGQIIGAGPGRGIGLLFIVAGMLLMLMAAAGTMYPRIRRVEDELPDVAANMARAAAAPDNVSRQPRLETVIGESGH